MLFKSCNLDGELQNRNKRLDCISSECLYGENGSLKMVLRYNEDRLLPGASGGWEHTLLHAGVLRNKKVAGEWASCFILMLPALPTTCLTSQDSANKMITKHLASLEANVVKLVLLVCGTKSLCMKWPGDSTITTKRLPFCFHRLEVVLPVGSLEWVTPQKTTRFKAFLPIPMVGFAAEVHVFIP